jgi:hypothetical protein
MAHALLYQAPSRPVDPAANHSRPSRDRFIDLLRATAIITIVCLHWLMPVVSYDDGVLSTANALATGAGWAITWVAQVMPLIFFAAGAAAAVSLDARRRRPGPGATSAWVAERLHRIGRPVIPLAAVWLALPYLLIAAGLPAQPVEIASALVGRLLWFLAAYVLLIILTPALLRCIPARAVSPSPCSVQRPSSSTSCGSAGSTVPRGPGTRTCCWCGARFTSPASITAVVTAGDRGVHWPQPVRLCWPPRLRSDSVRIR